jgi:hypothetical protein
MSAFLLPLAATAAMDNVEWRIENYGSLPSANILFNYPPEADFLNSAFSILNYPFEEATPPLFPPAWQTPPGGSTITPPGTATVIDNATDEHLEFFTFQTAAGNVFFLIIDRSRGTDNVYFLNAVTEWDLIALAERAEMEQPPDRPLVPPPLSPGDSADENDYENGNGDAPKPQQTTSRQRGVSLGTLIFAIAGAIVIIGVYYYIKIYRPKQMHIIEENDENNDFDEYSVDSDNYENLDVQD